VDQRFAGGEALVVFAEDVPLAIVVVREQTPRAAASNDGEDGVQDLARVMQSGATSRVRCCHVRLQARVLRIVEIGQIRTARRQKQMRARVWGRAFLGRRSSAPNCARS
jgi:hypothetical protein